MTSARKRKRRLTVPPKESAPDVHETVPPVPEAAAEEEFELRRTDPGRPAATSGEVEAGDAGGGPM